MSQVTVLLLALALLCTGCASPPAPQNLPISEIDQHAGYRRLMIDRTEELADTVVALSFSGGGTRAAALSYGVMQELRDTVLGEEFDETRLLDEVDSISSVSGGSFTAAYYGLFGDRLFEDFEEAFLRQRVQTSLIRRLLNPAQWFRSSLAGIDRTEMAVDFYDRKIFEGGTFGDLEARGGPFIEINATDLATGERFPFTQERFDLICSDLARFPVARAVTASSAVPVLFPTVVLENHADQCDITGTREWQILTEARDRAETDIERHRIDQLLSLRDAETRRYIHLVDGGISDNLGLLTLIDRARTLGKIGHDRVIADPPESLLIVLVNAEVDHRPSIEQQADKPGPSTLMSTMTNNQMAINNMEVQDDLEKTIETLNARNRAAGLPTRIYYSEVSFRGALSPEVYDFLNGLPTSLELEDDQLDRLIGAARMLLRKDPGFQRFKANAGARLADTAPDDDTLCRLFSESGCLPVAE